MFFASVVILTCGYFVLQAQFAAIRSWLRFFRSLSLQSTATFVCARLRTSLGCGAVMVFVSTLLANATKTKTHASPLCLQHSCPAPSFFGLSVQHLVRTRSRRAAQCPQLEIAATFANARSRLFSLRSFQPAKYKIQEYKITGIQNAGRKEEILLPCSCGQFIHSAPSFVIHSAP